MKHKYRYCFFLMFLLLISVSVNPFLVKASEGDVDYSVRAIIPDNQIDHLKSYFDLKMNLGQTQNLKVEVMNSGSSEAKVEMNVTFATTNNNGLIEYKETNKKNADKSLKIPLTELTKKVIEVITIPPGRSKMVTIPITMPKEKYDGVILGAVHFIKKVDEQEIVKNKSNGVNINNQYAYVVGIKLTETDKEVLPNLHLVHIKPTLVNYHTAVIANLQNSEAAITKDLNIDAKIYKKGSNKVFYRTMKENLSMAPNSNFDYAIDLNNDPLTPGTYRLKMKAVSHSQVWEWDEPFTIGKEATSLNKEAVEINHNFLFWYISCAIILFVLLILLIILIYRKKNIEIEE